MAASKIFFSLQTRKIGRRITSSIHQRADDGGIISAISRWLAHRHHEYHAGEHHRAHPEIGIRKAVGATIAISIQILVEKCCIALIGGSPDVCIRRLVEVLGAISPTENTTIITVPA